MIYIDPPYNTGKDFIYSDNYVDPLDTYLRITLQKDSEGNLLTSNPESSGRYHSFWLSMMYPRLFLARQLLRDDGVIFVSIDDHEAYNLRMILNEIFGGENFIAQLVWEKGRKNDAKLFSVGHEYIIVYARSLAKLRELKTIWREPKPGAKEIWDKYCQLRLDHGDNDTAIEVALQNWYRQLPSGDPSKLLSRYKHVDKYGPWRDRDISWPGGGGPRYDVPHPTTKQPCNVPERGWGFVTYEAMKRQIDLGLVVFREDHSEPPIRKAHLRPVFDELDENDPTNVDEEEESIEIGMQVMPSCIYAQSQVAVKYLRQLLGAKVFDNPKDHKVLARIIRYCTQPGDIILDFFAGSCSSAESILQLNHNDGGHRRFIMVQLTEPIKNGSVTATAKKMGYETIADIGKDRIRRIINKIDLENKGKLTNWTKEGVEEDLGFKVFKLAASHYRIWTGLDEKDSLSYTRQMELFSDPLSGQSWIPENVIYEIAIKEGYGLNIIIADVKVIKENTIYRVIDPDKDQSLYICLDSELHLESLKPLELSGDDLFICRDAALDDTSAANLALQCRLKTI